MCTRFSFAFTSTTINKKKKEVHRITACVYGGKKGARGLDSNQHHLMQFSLCSNARERVRGSFMLNNENCFLYEIFCTVRNFITHNAGEIQILFSGVDDVKSNTASLMQMTHNRKPDGISSQLNRVRCN